MSEIQFRNVIDGKPVDAASGATYDVIDPASGKVYATAPLSDEHDVEVAYAAADAAFDGWADTT
ncbi:MAG TPA: aldehyde dehydrogenase family protein, partial [Roseateles sp.]|nr:aldehyde dehydrogenase family protein [Roseateles sp.]